MWKAGATSELQNISAVELSLEEYSWVSSEEILIHDHNIVNPAYGNLTNMCYSPSNKLEIRDFSNVTDHLKP